MADIITRMAEVYPGGWVSARALAQLAGLTDEEIIAGAMHLMGDDDFRFEPDPLNRRHSIEVRIGGELRSMIKWGE